MDKASSARFVVTGPSGWIGRALLANLAARFGGTLDGRVTAFASSARSMDLPWGEQLAVRALESITAADVTGAHVVHLAYLTKEKAEEIGERAFTATNLAIDDAVLAALEGGAASVFVASSGAASLAADGMELHPYGLAKLRQEARFLEWGRRAGVPVIAGRIFNIAGPHINKVESYAISNFALQALDRKTIAISAQVPVFRSFLHVDDLANLVIEAAMAGVGRDRAVDLCGAEVLEMSDIAEAVGAAVGSDVTIERGAIDVTRPSAYLGSFPDTKSLAMQTGRKLRPFDVCIMDTLHWLQQSSLPR